MTKFYTDEMRAWLGGYEPSAAQQQVNDKVGRAAKKLAAANTERRMNGEMAGIGWGKGTVPGLGVKADPAVTARIKKARI